MDIGNDLVRMASIAIGIVVAIWLLSQLFDRTFLPLNISPPSTPDQSLPSVSQTTTEPVYKEFDLTGDQEVPSIQTQSTGLLKANLSQDRTVLNYELMTTPFLTPLTSAHFHLGPKGQNGPIVRTLKLEPALMNGQQIFYEKGAWTSTDQEPLTEQLVNELLNGNIYVNVHSQQSPNGEIRAQLHL